MKSMVTNKWWPFNAEGGQAERMNAMVRESQRCRQLRRTPTVAHGRCAGRDRGQCKNEFEQKFAKIAKAIAATTPQRRDLFWNASRFSQSRD